MSRPDRYLRPRNLSSFRITGRNKTKNEVCVNDLVCRLVRSLRIGTISTQGMPFCDVELFRLVSPPTMTVYPSGTVTLLEIWSVCRGGGTPLEPEPVKLFRLTLNCSCR